MGLFGNILSGVGAALPVTAVASALSGGLDFISQRQQNIFSAEQASKAENFSASQTAQQEAYQTEMSNTAHQREVADLRAAGLNPLLSANAGASSPSGSAATGVAAPVVPEIGSAVSSARDTLNMLQALKESNSRVAKNVADTDSAETASYKNRAGADLADSQTWLNKQERDLMDPEVSIAKSHPFAYGWSKVLSDRGVGASSAVDAARSAWDLIP